MTRSDLAQKLRRKTGLSHETSEAILLSIFGSIKAELAAGGEMVIRNFGTWRTRAKAERIGRNPKTGELCKISARRVPYFRAGKALKEEVING